MMQVALLACQAYLERRLLKIRYKAELEPETHRTIEVYLANDHYIDAYCRFRDDFRYFRIDRIQDAELLPENFPWKVEYFNYLKSTGNVGRALGPPPAAGKRYVLPKKGGVA
jgi:predicted DNA-binding transcriptional regulator YafY